MKLKMTGLMALPRAKVMPVMRIVIRTMTLALACGLVSAFVVLLVVVWAGGFDPATVTNMPFKNPGENLIQTFAAWCLGLFSPHQGVTWTGLPMDRVLGFAWFTTGLVMSSLGVAVLLSLAMAWSSLRTGLRTVESGWGLMESLFLAPPVWWAVIITGGWNLMVRLADREHGVMEAIGQWYWGNGWQFEPTALFFPASPSSPPGVAWLASLLVLMLGAGVFWDIKNGLVAELDRILSEEYILSARANGLPVGTRIARNLVVPFLTRAVDKLPVLFGEVIVVEKIFAIPGIGRELFTLIESRDAAAIMMAAAYFVMVVLVLRGVVDVLGGLINPPVREVVL